MHSVSAANTAEQFGKRGLALYFCSMNVLLPVSGTKVFYTCMSSATDCFVRDYGKCQARTNSAR